ncbi:cytochrome D ubiquinol oxidase subunit II [Ligilactobacillus salitolerans]|uniref:Cytochrome D ubiquinol oxidase subunit II n=1 Tax=Ligilactobacillus salitolerans TaxID=1808352 RepID=A0A401IRQ2_9LACO|nr:cytochrome d ubiquinol oxidase subunit II [Ligilactobacillus salitolerans]GBG94208.1 cytochrome D ubiquinol oxidase subunit II [Ligilactobacillus salitolerans]
MSTLQLIWFIIIGVLFAGFFFLEGFDFGVGMSVLTLAKDEDERDQVIATIGPVWDGNEVWLITAGGAMFASFPYWYSSLFSGYYLVLFIILFGLIIRGVSFEFRGKTSPEKKNIWNWTLGVGSFLVPFMFGIMFISLVQGVPMDAHGNVWAGFTDYVNLFSVVGGVALTLLAYLHGLNYIGLKTEWPLRGRVKKYAEILYPVLYVGLVVFAVLLYFKTDFFERHFAATLSLLVVIVLLSVSAHISVIKNNEGWAFAASGLTLVSLVALLFQGLFPRLMISSTKAANDLLITNSSSSPYTLKVMTIVVCTFLPLVLLYIGWTYYIFRKRVTGKKIKHEGSGY